MLEVRDLVVSCGAIEAVRGITLTAVPGAITAIVGANGAGKSSLLRAISGLAPIRGGQILLDGKDITTISPSRRAELGLAHAMEGRRIFRQLTVMPYVYWNLYRNYFDDVSFKLVPLNFPPAGVYFCKNFRPDAEAP